MITEVLELVKLKYLKSDKLQYGANESSDRIEEGEPRYIRITDLNEDGSLRKDTLRTLPLEIAQPYLLRDSDILLARSGATVGKSFIYHDYLGQACFAGYLICLRLKKSKIFPKFIWYYAQSSIYKQEIDLSTIQATIQNVSAEKYGEFRVPLHSLKTQKSIARFLDRKTAAIDTLIAKKQRLIQLLEEKRTALINQTVTKGLNPNAPMKDSGIPWIGEIPEHWEVLRLRRLISDKIAGPYGSSLTKSMYVSSGYRVYGQQQVIPGNFTVGDYYISPEKFLEMQRYLVQPKDVLVTVMGTIGRVAVVPEEIEPGIINPRLVKYVVRQKYILPHFFAWVFRSKAGEAQLSEMAQGVTMDGLNLTVLSDLWMPVPPLGEQNNIVTHIYEITDKNDQLQRVVRKQIEKLQEYRRSLITAAVTGKLDINNLNTEQVAKMTAFREQAAQMRQTLSGRVHTDSAALVREDRDR